MSLLQRIVGVLVLILIALPAHAQSVNDEVFVDGPSFEIDNAAYLDFVEQEEKYMKARVVEISEMREEEIAEGYVELSQELKLEILDGNERGKTVTVINGGIVTLDQFKEFEVDDKVILVSIPHISGENRYVISDYYRFPSLFVVLVIFVLLALWFGRKKGLGSLAGLAVSVFVIGVFMIPRILDGDNPVLIAGVSVLVIAGVSFYLAHGVNRRTSIALLSTLITMSIAAIGSYLVVHGASLFGGGSEAAFYLAGQYSHINLQGLFLAGVIIGTLGVLDDITTAQAAVVAELKHANPELSNKEVYQRALNVGKEHIASLVNTLVLAYVGAGLPLFILFTANEHVPWWVTLNGELVAEEVIRTLIGSSALILAVPITTFIAAHVLNAQDADTHHTHHHH